MEVPYPNGSNIGCGANADAVSRFKYVKLLAALKELDALKGFAILGKTMPLEQFQCGRFDRFPLS